MTTFSERMGIKKPRSILQIDDIDDELKHSLWNIISDFIPSEYGTVDNNRTFFQVLWEYHFKRPKDSLAYTSRERHMKLREMFYEMEWNEIYDLTQFIASLKAIISITTFTTRINYVLEREMAGYRLVGATIVPITNPQEVASVEKALELAKQNKLTGIEKHIEAAVSKLADRKNPDYRNSIKESISAVEAIVNRICGTEASLGDALKTLDKKLTLHGALKSGFSSIYGYTSDPKTGIRHFMLDEPNIGQEDAIFMLISCSAFINYLMIKCQKANIKLQ